MTLFGTPAILALPAGVDTMTTKIWSLFQFPPQLGLAAAASLPLLLITVVLLRAQTAIMGRRGYSVIGGKSTGARLIRLGAWKIPALALFAVVLGCSIVLPYGVLLRTAFVKNWSGPVIGNLSLEHWRFVFFEFSQTKSAFVNTFVLGVTAATAATILVTVVGYLGLRKLVWGHRYLAFLATAPVAIPGIVLAVGLFLSYTQPPLVLYGTLVDHLPRVPDQGASGRLPASRVVAEVGASRARGREPHLRRDTAARARRHHRAADPQWRHRDVDPGLHRLDSRAIGNDPAVYRAHQDHLGHDVRFAREQRLGAHRGTVDHHAGRLPL